MKELSYMFLIITSFFVPVFLTYARNETHALAVSSGNPFVKLQ
jgi:hypothetical protein